ncbi:flagellar basal body P-ring formation protein FlgA [Psychrosphaera sp. F3M07]|nr:flagellar basal body P-ring formation protein FlgA [Psychrosphaera sp. F3M07]
MKIITKNYYLLFITLLMSMNVSASLSNTLTHDELLKDVISYVEQEFNPDESKNLRVVAHPLDSRITIRECDQDLSFYVAKSRTFTRQFPVKVKCATEKNSWKVYVQVSVAEMIETLVTNQTIAKGNTVDIDMVEVELVEARRVKDRSSNDISSIVGGRALKNIQRGYQIGQNDVCLVCKGDDVSIIAKNGGMMIKTSGTAIENGAKGESIKVKNNSSSRIVKGIVGDLREIYVNL